MEGNTYSLLETERLLATGEEPSGKDHVETQMILNHKDAIEFIVDMAEEIDINRYTILNIHGLLSNDLLLDPKACGRLRTIPRQNSQIDLSSHRSSSAIRRIFPVNHTESQCN